MPCYDSRDTPAGMLLVARRREKNGRFDLLATKEDLGQWLCDALNGREPHPDALRWLEAHRKYEDADDDI